MLGELLTAIVTPFDRDGAVDYERFRDLARHCVENGSDGLVVAATTGESPTLTDDERFELFSTAVDAVGDGATVIGSTGTYSTAHSVHLTERAHELGVDGFLVVTPYYNKPPPRGIVEHFKAIAAVSDRPIVVYNIPQRVVINIEPETIAELAEIPTVKAVKQATEEIDQAQADRRRDRPRPLRGQRPSRLPVPRGRRRRRGVRARPDRRPAGEGDDPPLQGRRHGGRARARRGAEARGRGSRGDDQPDPGEGRADHARARCRRAAAAARRGDRRGAGRDPRQASSAPACSRPSASSCSDGRYDGSFGRFREGEPDAVDRSAEGRPDVRRGTIEASENQEPDQRAVLPSERQGEGHMAAAQLGAEVDGDVVPRLRLAEEPADQNRFRGPRFVSALENECPAGAILTPLDERCVVDVPGLSDSVDDPAEDFRAIFAARERLVHRRGQPAGAQAHGQPHLRARGAQRHLRRG